MNKALALTDQVSEGEAEFIFYYQAAFNGDGSKQKEHLDKLEQLHPNDRYVLYQLGIYHYGSLNDYNKALTYFNKVTKVAPTYGPTYNMIGYCNIELVNYDAAETALKKYIELTPDSPNPYDSYAELLLTMGKYDQSIEHYQKAYDKDNNFTTALDGIGNNYAMKGDFEKAREYYNRVIDETARTNEKFGSMNSIVTSYVEEGNIDKAIEVCEKRFELAKDQELTNFQVGSLNTAAFILCENDKIAETKMYYDRVAKIVKTAEMVETDRVAYELGMDWNKCYVLGAENKLEEASTEAAKCFKMAEKRGAPADMKYAHSQLATLELRKGEHQKALDHLKKAFPDSPYDWYQMALAYEGLEMTDKSTELYQRIANQNEIRIDLAVVRQKAKAKL
jgi:tetratricopeptide (TPR) repeat protein